jgi:hypothetical protein
VQCSSSERATHLHGGDALAVLACRVLSLCSGANSVLIPEQTEIHEAPWRWQLVGFKRISGTCASMSRHDATPVQI